MTRQEYLILQSLRSQHVSSIQMIDALLEPPEPETDEETPVFIGMGQPDA